MCSFINRLRCCAALAENSPKSRFCKSGLPHATSANAKVRGHIFHSRSSQEASFSFFSNSFIFAFRRYCLACRSERRKRTDGEGKFLADSALSAYHANIPSPYNEDEALCTFGRKKLLDAQRPFRNPHLVKLSDERRVVGIAEERDGSIRCSADAACRHGIRADLRPVLEERKRTRRPVVNKRQMLPFV